MQRKIRDGWKWENRFEGWKRSVMLVINLFFVGIKVQTVPHKTKVNKWIRHLQKDMHFGVIWGPARPNRAEKEKAGICMPLEKEACAALCFTLISLHFSQSSSPSLCLLPFLLSFLYPFLSSIILLTNLPAFPFLSFPLSSWARSLRGVRPVPANSSSNSPLLTEPLLISVCP